MCTSKANIHQFKSRSELDRTFTKWRFIGGETRMPAVKHSPVNNKCFGPDALVKYENALLARANRRDEKDLMKLLQSIDDETTLVCSCRKWQQCHADIVRKVARSLKHQP